MLQDLRKYLAILFLIPLFSGCASAPKEKKYNIFALEVASESKRELMAEPLFDKINAEAKALQIIRDQNSGWGYLSYNSVYQLLQNEEHLRGLWQRMSLNDYIAGAPRWETLLDVDQLAFETKQNYTFRKIHCLKPALEVCLAELSIGGSDKSLILEYDLKLKKITEGPNTFSLPLGSPQVAWIDKQHIYFSDYGQNKYLLRKWKRGTRKEDAPIVVETTAGYLTLREFPSEKGSVYAFYNQSELYIKSPLSSEFHILALPGQLEPRGVVKDQLLLSAQEDYNDGERVLPRGSLLSFPLDKIAAPWTEAVAALKIVFRPAGKRFFEGVTALKDYALIEVVDNINRKILLAKFNAKKDWQISNLTPWLVGSAWNLSQNYFENDFLFLYSSYLTPHKVYYGRAQKPENFILVKKHPDVLQLQNYVAERREAKSKDGTMIPYSLIRAKNLKRNAKNPTLIYGYGGFNSATLPLFDLDPLKLWVEKGGVYVLPHLRGGGEFGLAWHEAAIKEKKQNTFDDLYAVAEDLIKTGITSPTHLGVMGISNGGLLASVALTQRPDLFNAVVAINPLTNMIDKENMGHGWNEEYGSAYDSEYLPVLQSYSPLHHIDPDQRYPESFFIANSNDDRVNPEHAQSMVYELRKAGNKVLFYQPEFGGHGSENTKEKILKQTFIYTYLWRRLK